MGNSEKNLTLAEVLRKHRDGPQDGVFTDGGARPNPGPGGWGVVWVEDGKMVEHRYGSDPDTTNNRMELTGLIEAFKLIPEDREIAVYSDSELCVNTLTKWAASWERNGWRRKDGAIKNVELVKEAYALYKKHPHIKLQWVKAHNGWLWNEYADSLATAWARETL